MSSSKFSANSSEVSLFGRSDSSVACPSAQGSYSGSESSSSSKSPRSGLSSSLFILFFSFCERPLLEQPFLMIFPKEVPTRLPYGRTSRAKRTFYLLSRVQQFGEDFLVARHRRAIKHGVRVFKKPFIWSEGILA